MVEEKKVVSEVSELGAYTQNTVSDAQGSPSPAFINEQTGKFKMVSHRADRNFQAPIVMRVTGGRDFRMTNPISLHSDILKLPGELPSRLKLNNTDTISVDFRSNKAAAKLLAACSPGGIPIDAQLPAVYRANGTLGRGIPTSYTDDTLLA